MLCQTMNPKFKETQIALFIFIFHNFRARFEMIFKFFSKKIKAQKSKSLVQGHTAGIRTQISWLRFPSSTSIYRVEKIPSRLAHIIYFHFESLGG